MEGCEEMKERKKKLFCWRLKVRIRQIWVKLTPVPTGTHTPMKTLKELDREDRASPARSSPSHLPQTHWPGKRGGPFIPKQTPTPRNEAR